MDTNRTYIRVTQAPKTDTIQRQDVMEMSDKLLEIKSSVQPCVRRQG